jgi:hypothetical protein
VSNQQLLPNLPSRIQMANTLKLRITQALIPIEGSDGD